MGDVLKTVFAVLAAWLVPSLAAAVYLFMLLVTTVDWGVGRISTFLLMSYAGIILAYLLASVLLLWFVRRRWDWPVAIGLFVLHGILSAGTFFVLYASSALLANR